MSSKSMTLREAFETTINSMNENEYDADFKEVKDLLRELVKQNKEILTVLKRIEKKL